MRRKKRLQLKRGIKNTAAGKKQVAVAEEPSDEESEEESSEEEEEAPVKAGKAVGKVNKQAIVFQMQLLF